MIPILYNRDERVFTSQGVCRLYDMVSCVVTEERNGIYECEFQYPINGEFFSKIVEGSFIGVTHDDKQDIQPFEIYGYSAPINGVVTFYAHHLSYKLRSYVLKPYLASSCSGALSVMAAKSMSPCPFTFWTDKGTIADFEVKYPVNIKSILAGEEGSILDVYGPGEFEYDIWTVKFHESRGNDNGVQIRYGKNLTDITHEYDESEIYSAVIPYYYSEDEDGHRTLVVPDDYRAVINEDASVHPVYWTNEDDEIIRTETGEPIEFGIDNTVYTAIDLTSEFDEPPTVEELVARAKELFEQNKPWEPDDNIKISFVSLWQTPEYKDIAPLEKVGLCDIVEVIYPNLNIKTKTKVIKTVYNVLLDRYDSIELGDAKLTYANAIKDELKNQIAYLEEGMQKRPTSDYVNQQLAQATDMIRGGLGGYIVMTPNADGQPQEILVLDRPNLEDAINVIRINRNGIGFSNNGYEGPFNSAWLINGTFDAQQINVINLAATIIRTGLLTDAYGDNFWNLDTGEFRLSMETKIGQDNRTLLDLADKAETLKDVSVEYAISDSSTEAPTEGWSTETPVWDWGKYIWQRTKTVNGVDQIDYSYPTCIQGASGSNGISTAVVQLYKRSATAATINWNTNLTYDFSTHKLISIPTGWYEDIPEGDNPLYVTAATASSREGQDTIAPSEWATPVILAQDGEDGLNSATIFLYQRSANPSQLRKPTGDIVYTFSTGEVTGALGNWSKTIPDSNGNSCYVIQATAVSAEDTDTIAKTEWSEIIEFVGDGRGIDTVTEFYAINNSASTAPEDSSFSTTVVSPTATNRYLWNYEVISYTDNSENTRTAKHVIGVFGNTGTAGRNTATVLLYKRSTTTPTIDWTNALTYTFSTGKLTSVPSGWSQTIPSGTNPIYMTAATASATTATDSIASSEWATPILLSQNGANTATVFLYQRAASTPTKPTATLTYTFATGLLSGTMGDWEQTIPAGDGNPCYSIQATAVSTGTTDTIAKTEWSAPVILVEDGNDGLGIKTITNYYLATAASSGVTRSTAGWTTTVQSVTETKVFLWNYETVTYTDNTSVSTDPCIIGAYGKQGQGVKNIVDQYYLSTSKTKQQGGQWTGAQPAWVEGRYIWMRALITWTDDTQTTTTPYLANAINGANQAVKDLDDSLNQQEVFNRLTNNSQTEGVYLENGHLYINASMLKTGIISDARTKPKNYWNLNNGVFVTQQGTIANFEINEDGLVNGDIDQVLDLSNMVPVDLSQFDPRIDPHGLYPGETETEFRNHSTHWMEKQDGNYVFTTDRSIVSGKTYYYFPPFVNAVDISPGRIGMCGGTDYQGDWGRRYEIKNGRCIYYQWEPDHYDWSEAGRSFANYLGGRPGVLHTGHHVFEDIAVAGTATGFKSKLIDTDAFGLRLLYSYETPSPMFGDVGEGTIGSIGTTVIFIEPIFATTISGSGYQVFLQKYGDGDCYVSSRSAVAFTVTGTPGLSFGWEIKAKQSGFENIRLEMYSHIADSLISQIGELAQQFLEQLRKWRTGT